MTITGTVRNGAIVPDVAAPWPEGAKVSVSDDGFEDLADFEVRSLPPDHPMSPYDRDTEVALVLGSIAAIEKGEPTISLREAFEELSRKHGLSPMPAK